MGNIMDRPSINDYWMKLAIGVASRATCPRRKVGAIITDAEGFLLASGYNGPPKDIPNCIDTPCPGRYDKSGDSSRCLAVHAEANAILQLGDRIHRAHKLYSTTFPCFECAKLICQTKIKHIYYLESYPDERGAGIFHIKGINYYGYTEKDCEKFH